MRLEKETSLFNKDAIKDDIDTAKANSQYFWHDSAGAHITEDTQEDYQADPSSAGGNTLITSQGVAIRKGTAELATFTANGARIGQSSGAHSEIDTNGQRFYGSPGFITNNPIVQLANIGYGEGANMQGQDEVAPYYSFGIRAINGAVKATSYKPGNYSSAEGVGVIAQGYASHAEGYDTEAVAVCSHAEGTNTYAVGDDSHAEGNGTYAIGVDSHAEGLSTEATGRHSHAGGYCTTAGYDGQTVIGQYNKNNSDNVFEIGNGTGASAQFRSNALTVDWNGNVKAGSDITDGSGNVLSNKVDLTNEKPLFKKVSVTHSFTVGANSYSNQSFAPAAQSGYTRVGIVGWNTASTHVFISTCTGTTITFCNKSSSNVTCNNAQVDWLFIRSSI